MCKDDPAPDVSSALIRQRLLEAIQVDQENKRRQLPFDQLGPKGVVLQRLAEAVIRHRADLGGVSKRACAKWLGINEGCLRGLENNQNRTKPRTDNRHIHSRKPHDSTLEAILRKLKTLPLSARADAKLIMQWDAYAMANEAGEGSIAA